MNIELYIKNRLCDIDSPESLGIRLKRQFINPAELSVKDAQKSYEITLPATPANNEIFSYANVEETQGKFRVYEDARLYADGILILDGKFRLSEISGEGYKGNLGVPAPLTVKDIFGETMMNQAGKWMIPFKGVESITGYNTGVYNKSKFKDGAPCIFPLVLYGLLPKNSNTEKNPDKELFDSNVFLNNNDLPPSVNCLQMLERIFANANYKLAGTAMNDECLRKLYVSYKNLYEYEMPWNAPQMKIKGKWYNYDADTKWIEAFLFENLEGGQNNLNTATVNLFSCNRTEIEEVVDDEHNIEIAEKPSMYDPDIKIKFKVPRSGLYKVEFDASIIMGNGYFRHSDAWYGINGGNFDRKYELKLVRNCADYTTSRFDNTFYKDNINQVRGGENPEKFLFPQGGNVNFIDPKQNPKFICGFSWGNDTRTYMADYYNPFNVADIRANPMAISGGRSWSYYDKEAGTEERYYSAVKSPGYRNAAGEVSSFKVDIANAPYPETYYIPANTDGNPTAKAGGRISQIVWLDSGDELSVVSMSCLDLSKYDGHPIAIWPNHHVNFELAVTPFQQSRQWLTIDDNGSSNPEKPLMDWNDTTTLLENEINLIKFLPAEIKVNDWIDNFCKAFNLNLINTGKKNFELNVKVNEIPKNLNNLIDLDRRANVKLCRNESLRLPSAYELGFTVNNSEKGYYDSIDEYVIGEDGKPTDEKVITAGDSGGGKYRTNSIETSVVQQTSNFSYNWFKKIRNAENNSILELPVITEQEIWEHGADYSEMSRKRYINLSQRFWFQSGYFTTNTFKGDKQISLATVTERYEGIKRLALHYRNEPDSIMRNYFLLMVNNNNSYTIVNCHLTPEEYAEINKSMVKLNGDLYNIAEVDGYDPLGKEECALKLIRRIV
ncbi:MAG: hypothetical protein LBN74_09090 [Prevotella sp.]|jgi:hypothetical protein|nr:hypothetical protein [Prevotella sp.]